MPVLEALSHARTWGIGEQSVEVPVPIRFEKEYTGRYNVVRSDTGQILGWVYKKDGIWEGCITNSAYYPAAADVMIRTDKHPSHRGEWFQGEYVGIHGRREDAAREILYRLLDRRADSLEDLVTIARAPFEASRKASA